MTCQEIFVWQQTILWTTLAMLVGLPVGYWIGWLSHVLGEPIAFTYRLLVDLRQIDRTTKDIQNFVIHMQRVAP